MHTTAYKHSLQYKQESNISSSLEGLKLNTHIFLHLIYVIQFEMSSHLRRKKDVCLLKGWVLSYRGRMVEDPI